MALGWDDAIGAAAPIVGQGLGLIFGKSQDKRQLKQQKKLQALAIEGQKEMGNFQQQKQMEMWNQTNAEAQMQHYKNAGLNSALMYGGSGAGGATVGGSTGSGTSAASASDAAATQQASQGMGMLAAQTALMAAQTEKTKAETAKISGADTTLAGAQTESLKQGIEASKAAINKIGAEIANINTNTEISQATKQDQIKIKAEEAVSQVLTNMLMAEQKDQIRSGTEKNRSDIEVNEGKIKQMSQQILQGWEGLRQGQEQIAIGKFREEIKAKYPGLWDVGGKTLDDLMQTIYKAIHGKEDVTKEIK